jgi:hypothetical protein
VFEVGDVSLGDLSNQLFHSLHHFVAASFSIILGMKNGALVSVPENRVVQPCKAEPLYNRNQTVQSSRVVFGKEPDTQKAPKGYNTSRRFVTRKL